LKDFLLIHKLHFHKLDRRSHNLCCSLNNSLLAHKHHYHMLDRMPHNLYCSLSNFLPPRKLHSRKLQLKHYFLDRNLKIISRELIKKFNFVYHNLNYIKFKFSCQLFFPALEFPQELEKKRKRLKIFFSKNELYKVLLWPYRSFRGR
jgi:hypothetical protein